MRDYLASAFSTDIQTTELADSGRAMPSRSIRPEPDRLRDVAAID
jgi:hypothetical protein